MTKFSEQMLKAYAKLKYNKNPFDLTKNNSKSFTFNNHNYTEYEELFYYFEKNSQNEYSATVYGIPEIQTKNIKIATCEKNIRKKIDRYIFNHKTQLLSYPRPIPDGISLYYETIKASIEYDLRALTTTSLHDAFRKIKEQTIAILENYYEKITHDELDKALKFEQIYNYRHGDIIKKLLNGLNLYDNDSNRQIKISEIFNNTKNQSDFFCIYIANNNILSIEIESDQQNIKYYPCQKSNTYKFLFEPSSLQETEIFPIKITTDNNIIKRTYLTISKINADTYSYFFQGSDNFNTENGSIHLCAKKNFTDKLASIFPESISDFQPQRFELFIFEFSKLLQFAIFTNFDNYKLFEYIARNNPIEQKCYNLLITKDDLDKEQYDQQDQTIPFIEKVIKTLRLIDTKKSISEYDFSILKEALQKSDELVLSNSLFTKCTIYCWRYIESLQEYEIYAKIVLLKIEQKMSDKEIFYELCKLYKNFTEVKKLLHIREDDPEQIKNIPNIINSRYVKIYEIADKFELLHPPLQRSKIKKDKK